MTIHMAGNYLGNEFQTLEGIKTRSDFAGRFKVNKDTFANWNAVVERQGIVRPKIREKIAEERANEPR